MTLTDFETGESYEVTQPLPLLTSVEGKEAARIAIREKVLNGEINPLEVYRQAKLMELLIEEIKKDPDILDAAQSERDKYGKEKPKINGAVVDNGSKTTYDYASCGDPVYDKLKEDIKAREAFLKAIPAGGTVDPETGLLIQPPVQKISNFITVKI